MPDSPASLRRKISSAADLQSVVRAMKAQAAASIGQYTQSVAALADYARTVDLGLSACFRQTPLVRSASAEMPAAGRRRYAVVFGSDQGLIGRFNDSVVERAASTLAGSVPSATVWAVGERIRASLTEVGLSPQVTFNVPSTVRAITGLVSKILTAVADASSDSPHSESEVHLFYNRPMIGATYTATGLRLLPLDDAWRRNLSRQPWPTPLLAQVWGDPTQTLRGLIREYVFVSLFRASAESLASETASRLAAMERADRNIDKMLLELHDNFHRLRQSQIDEELSDVISGFKALQHGGIEP